MDARRREQLCQGLVLMERLSIQITRDLVARLDPLLASNGPIAILASLAANGPQRPRALQPVAGLSGAGLSNLLRRLEDRGLVNRSAGDRTGDQRAVIVELTDEGRRTEAAISEVVLTGMCEARPGLKELIEILEELGARSRSPAAAAGGTHPSRLTLALAVIGVVLNRALRLPGARGVALDASATLALVGLADVGQCRPGYLAELLGITSGGATRLVDRLEDAGLVGRAYAPIPDDRRSVVITLTPMGLEHLDLVLDRVSRHIHDLYEAVVAAANELQRSGRPA